MCLLYHLHMLHCLILQYAYIVQIYKGLTIHILHIVFYFIKTLSFICIK